MIMAADSFDLNQLENDALLYEQMLDSLGFNPEQFQLPLEEVIQPSSSYEYIHNQHHLDDEDDHRENSFEDNNGYRDFIQKVMRDKILEELSQTNDSSTSSTIPSTSSTSNTRKSITTTKSINTGRTRQELHMNRVKHLTEREFRDKCTFQPATNRRNKPKQLSKERIDFICKNKQLELNRRIVVKEQNECQELQKYTFKPRINKISECIASHLRSQKSKTSDDPDDIDEYEQWLKQRLKEENEDKENREIPNSNNKHRSIATKSTNPTQQSVPNTPLDTYEFKLIRFPLSSTTNTNKSK
jgi:hypothetical protein